MSLIKEYFDLTNKYCKDYGDNTILLMQVGSFFEVYGKCDNTTNVITGSRINSFSQICELNVVEKNVCVGKDAVLMAGFKDIMIEKYLKKIQDAGFTAVVYTQDQAAKNTTRSCAGIFSPGTYFSSDSQKLTNNITCIWIDKIENKMLCKGTYIIVGVSNIDIYTGKTSIFQFKESYIHSPTTYDELERFVSIYNPSEVIFISNIPDKELDDVIKFIDIQTNSIHKISIHNDVNKGGKFDIQVKNCEKQIYQKEILKKFYNLDNFEIFLQNFYDNNIAAQSFCFLLDFVYQHNPNLVNRISEPLFENCSSRLHLANYSLKQLNVIDDNNHKGKYSSVLNMLNDCCTPMGKREFAYKFTNPTTEIEYLQDEYDITEYFVNNYEKYKFFLNNHLSTIKDLSKYQRQVFIKKVTPKTFYYLYNNLLTIMEIYKKIRDDTTIYNYLLKTNNSMGLVTECCQTLIDAIVKHIDISLAKDIDQLQGFEINFIQPTIDEELDAKSDLLKSSEAKLESIRFYLNSIIPEKTKSSSVFIKIHETEKNNFALVCTNRRCKLLENALPNSKTTIYLKYENGNSNTDNCNTDNSNTDNSNTKEFSYTLSKNQFEYKSQSSSNNFIVDDTIKQLCKNISTIKVSLKDIITLVFNRFVNTFEEYKDKLDIIVKFITIIDILFNKATIAKKYNYCKPIIVNESPKSFINAKKLRHCLIEHIQTNELYTANDIILGDDNMDGILLYGTNAVGKTSFIRAIGIAVIMAQAGLFVPCSSFHYKPYKYIFTRILGNDNIFKGLSTFAVEMSELRTILKLADENSLILGDELCSGTEIMSAISIFVSGIQKLNQLKSSYIFATHLHEIVNYEEIKQMNRLSLKHMEVIYNKEKDMLIYDRTLKDGPGNNMYGLEVCKSLSMPEDFLNRAHEIRMKYSPQYNNVLSIKSSHFNAKKLMGMCEQCGENIGKEVHHLQHQKEANNEGIINNHNMIFHKNNLANLITLCDECHDTIHKLDVKGSKKVKTNKGYILQSL